MSNKLHDHGDHFITSPKAEPFLERLIFNNRGIIVLLFVLLTGFLGYQASLIRPDASFERLIPLKHEFIRNMMENRDDLENLGNYINIAVAVKEGDIYTEAYMETLRQITDEVFFLPGIDRAGVKSIWTPNVRWVEVTEQGFQGGTVIPDGYDGSRASLDKLRENLLRSGDGRRLLAENFQSSIVYAPLMENDPETGQPLDYRKFSQLLEERIRDKYQAQNPDVTIHIVGFAKKVGDLIEGIKSVAMFALITLGLALVLLYAYSRCIAGTLIPIISSFIAVVWQIGLLRLLGYGLDPYSVLVPFLVFAIGISHGVQIVNAAGAEAAKGYDSKTAARLAFRSLYVPGMLALLSDAIGFLTLMFIEIDVIQGLAIAASIGVAVIIVTNLVLHPVILSYTGISASGKKHARKLEQTVDRKWVWMSYFAHPSVAPISVLIAIVGSGLGFYYKQDLKIGDLNPGAPELRPDSRYNIDNSFIISNYSTSSDVMVIMVKTEPEQCTTYPVLRAIDRLQWKMENTPGVQSTASLATVSKLVTKALNEGSLKWYELSPSQQVINSSIQRAPSGLVNQACTMTPVIVYLEDHKAETLKTVVASVQAFAADYQSESFRFLLAAGNAGVDAATNEVIERANNQMLLFVYAVVAVMCFLTFRSFRAVICLMVPLVLTSILCEALMAQLGIGIKVETLPVIALGVGIGVDYGIYIYTRLEKVLLEGKSLQDAYYDTLRTTGRAVMFTGLTLGMGVFTWIFSPIQFQANMGVLLFFMFIWNMIGALWLLPALARFMLNPERMLAKAKAAEAALAARNR